MTHRKVGIVRHAGQPVDTTESCIYYSKFAKDQFFDIA